MGNVMGCTEARLFTKPLRELTPETSYGFAVIKFADEILNEPLDPWQEWAVIHAGEVLPDGRPRFKKVLILVARQNGKTHLLKVLALFWLFIVKCKLILGMSTNISYAQESWSKAVETAEENEHLSALLPKNAVKRGNDDKYMRTVHKCRYKIAASNRKGGRSLSVDRLIIDELCQHQDWSAWNAAVPATMARPYAQVFCITNQGDEKAIVLDSLRESALTFIQTGIGDARLGLLEWSAPDGADVTDPSAWAAANPNLGHRLHPEDLAGDAARVKAKGGEEEAKWRTEYLCQRVRALDAAVDAGAWKECSEPGAMPKERVTMCVDISPDGQHASLAAATVLPDGRTRVEIVADWKGAVATKQLRNDLPQWIDRIKPKTLGWFPSGPAAAMAADLAARKGRTAWPPRGVTVEEIRGEVSAVCMGFAELVKSKQVVHSDQLGLNAHVTGAEKLRNGDAWRFSRKGEGNCDSAYAAAGAVHLARTQPTSLGKPRLVLATA